MLEQLNLRPSERRLLVVVGLVLFVVLNLWMVWPRFGDLQKVKRQRKTASLELQKRQQEIADMPAFQARVVKLEAAGSSVPEEDQSLEFMRTIEQAAGATGVTIMKTPRQRSRTNQFFLERSRTIETESGEPELVAFLYDLGVGDSEIRVRELVLRPKPPGRYQLTANIELVASYQKKTRPRSGQPPAQTRAADR